MGLVFRTDDDARTERCVLMGSGSLANLDACARTSLQWMKAQKII
jgi:hypothetical protein